MLYIILNVLLGVLLLYCGIILGVNDCKKAFGIPKGVKNMEEWTEYSRKECEDFINE